MKLFGTAGIRGNYPQKINASIAFKIGLALAKFYDNKGNGVVGKDVRSSSDILSFSLSSGLMAGGMDVTYIGLSPTPLIAYSTDKLGAKTGISITASHNPPEDNGIKIFGPKGFELTENEEQSIEDIALNKDDLSLSVGWIDVGKIYFNNDISSRYIDDMVNKIGVSNKQSDLKILVDCANGSASNITPKILTKLNVGKVICINCNYDERFQGRLPEPRPDVLEPYIDVMKQMKSDLLVAHDGDADRMAIAVPEIGFVKQDLVIALFAKHFLSKSKGTIVVSVDVGNEVEEIVEKHGGKIVRAKLGKIHEKILEYNNVLMAAEPWKLIDPEWGIWIDGIYEAALLLKIIIEEKKKPTDLIKELPNYPSARISFNMENITVEKNNLIKEILNKISYEIEKGSYSLLDIDGYRISFKDGSWILMRASGTENKIRFYMQSYKKEKLKQLIDMSKNYSKNVIESHGIKIRNIEEHIDYGDK